MTVYAITDTKKRRTGIAPTYLQKTTTTRNSTVCLCIFSRSAFYPTFRSTFPHAEFRILHVRDFPHSAFYRCPWHTARREGNYDKAYVWVFCKWPWVSRFTFLRTAWKCGRMHRESRPQSPAYLMYLAWRDSTGIIITVCESNKKHNKLCSCASTCLQHAPHSFPCQMYTYYFYYQFYDIHNTV